MEIDPKLETLIALDVGERRIGVARAFLAAPFPTPLQTLDNPETFVADIVAICRSQKAAALVVGLPRSLNGEDTGQTRRVRDFVAKLEPELTIPVYWTDEAVTSAQAETELQKRGKPYVKADIDALAATYILEDYCKEHSGGNG